MKHRPFTIRFISWLSLLFSLLGPVGCRLIESLGRNPSGEALRKLEALPNYRDGKFRNRKESGLDAGKVRGAGILKQFIDRPETVRPSRPIPWVQTDLTANTFSRPTVIWFGHSSFLIRTTTATLLVDPNFSDYAGPASWMVGHLRAALPIRWQIYRPSTCSSFPTTTTITWITKTLGSSGIGYKG
jgi:hypothetical protein